jgi:CDP-paratose 2-epimerase
MYNIVITGGAGFVGSCLALYLAHMNPGFSITCFDNLHRRGSELNLPRLREAGIRFIHGDIRIPGDLEELPFFDLLIECSAEPSVLAGITSSPSYLLETNLVGTLNCLEIVRKNHASLIFLSTSRVYPIEPINSQVFSEKETRFIPEGEFITGFSDKGITEDFPLSGVRSLYGTTKLCSELCIEEYAASYGIPAIINRCGLLSGPWQMGKVDQGVVMHWVISHMEKKELSYIGYGGKGKQVRDVLHIDDLCALINLQIADIPRFSGTCYNVGGGILNSVSLQELTAICQEVTGNSVLIHQVPETRQNDLIWYVTDNTRISQYCGWKPMKCIRETVMEIATWIGQNRSSLLHILDPGC